MAHEMGHYGRKEVKFGDAGDTKMLAFEVSDVTKPLVAVTRIIDQGNEVHLEAENFIRNARKAARFP